MELVPGNCAERYVAYKNTQGQAITDAEIRAVEVAMGLDKPFFQRWGGWVERVVFHFDLGESCLWQTKVSQIIGDKLWLSLAMSFAALVLTYLLALPIGILSANIRDSWADSSLRFISYLGLAMPNFMLALIVMLYSTVQFGNTMTGLFSNTYIDAPWSWDKFMDLMNHIWLPILILAWSALAIQMQTVRALVSDEKDKLYVLAARARGQDGAGLLWKYPARHALGPVINSVAYDLNRIFNDLPIVATVLVLTDAGALLLEALAKSNDQQLAGGIIFVLTATIVALNFVTDIIVALIDPRVRKGLF